MGKKNQKPACIYGAVYMLKQVNRLESEITGALVSDDIEHVHRLRVASRRLRNGLGLFRELPIAKNLQNLSEAHPTNYQSPGQSTRSGYPDRMCDSAAWLACWMQT
jgi:hypothetical protein